MAQREMAAESQRLERLAVRLKEGLVKRLDGLTVNGPEIGCNSWTGKRLAGNVHISFSGVSGESLLAAMKEIAVSSGSACTSADPQPSHVLRAMGVSEALTLASLRFGLGRTTTAEEIEFAIQYVSEVVSRLRDET